MVKTKIIATLGPTSGSENIIRKMYRSGLDIVRLNFSHSTRSQHLKRIKMIRALNRKLKRSVKIMQDLEGYRIRVRGIRKPLELKKNECLYLVQEDTGGSKKSISFDYKGSLKYISRDTLVYIDDGKVVLKVLARAKKHLKVQVLSGGTLLGNKGINIPGAKLEFPALTEKDKKDAALAVENKLDYIAQSFVNSRKDIKLLKDLVKPFNPACQVFAKIESREALENIDGIINESDGIIVARGDLGICMPIYKVPVIQKEIIKKCRLKGKPVVVATQMMESMKEELLPTRAEVSDVANAILEGADYLMLSAETAIGKHPHLVVEMMNKVIINTEKYREKLRTLML